MVPQALHVLVTGANGFVGRALCRQLLTAGHTVTAVVRRAVAVVPGCHSRVLGDLVHYDDWRTVLNEVDAVVHLAALTHGAAAHRAPAWASYQALNVDVSARLGAAAAACGVARFLYLSSIKVNGEGALPGVAVTPRYAPHDVPAPEDHYGRSKLAAEEELTHALAARAALTIVRPPLIYGVGQRGNLARLARLVARGVPLPFARLDNRRSLVHVDNLAQALVCALARGGVGARCYTLADVELSTPQLVQVMAAARGVPARLFGIPSGVWPAFARWPALRPLVQRVAGSLLVDSSAALQDLGWQPLVAPAAALAASFAAPPPTAP